MMNTEAVAAIKRNQRAYNKVSPFYESLHGEIFNSWEQQRLNVALSEAIANIHTNSEPMLAFDYGCGSGNLTRHLLDLGLSVTAADVSKAFLTMVSEKFRHTGKLKVQSVNGSDLAEIADASFDITASYSVLHHVPDYLRIVRELHRITKPGGIIYLDHESNGIHWTSDPCYTEFLARISSPNKPTGFRIPTLHRCVHKLRRMALRVRQLLNPRYMPEGDIHVWPDDHIEWDSIKTIFEQYGAEIVKQEDYLLCASWYSPAVFEEFKDRCADTRLLVTRKR